MAFVLPDPTQRHVLPVHRGSQHKLHSRRQPPCRQPCRADAGTRSLEQAVRVSIRCMQLACVFFFVTGAATVVKIGHSLAVLVLCERLGMSAGAEQGDRHCQQPAEPQEG
jgi:hypothetical protein